MRSPFFFCLMFLCFNAFAESRFRTQIHDIDRGLPGEETLILLTNGHVAKILPSRIKSIDRLNSAKVNNRWLDISLNDKGEIIQLTEVSNPDGPQLETKIHLPDNEYTPTVLSSMDEAQRLFNEGRYKDKESQCYNRAHVWSFEWFRFHQVFSNKTWIFFTRKYIRRFAFKWWFHVAPSVLVNDNGEVKEKIMDVKYARGPLDLKTWSDIFMRNDSHCPMVKTYSDYANYPETGWCYSMRTSMFYYQPADIEHLEVWETQKANWVDAELIQAFQDAMDELL